MPTIYFRMEYPCNWGLGADVGADQKENCSPEEFMQEGVSVRVDPLGDFITGTVRESISSDAFESLSSWLKAPEIPKEWCPEISEIVERIEHAVKVVDEILRFSYPLNAFLGVGRGGLSYSEDSEDWKNSPAGYRMYSLWYRSHRQVSEGSRALIQGQIDAKVRPLFAFKHIERAKLSCSPRFQWIDATIAAELGVKEFLVRKAPALETLLLEMPSPPLRKLYGSILKEYGGGESPWKPQLEKGAAKRNELVHRFLSPDPELQETYDYVNIVIATLYDLMSRLYPKDETIRELAEGNASLVENAKKRAKRKSKEKGKS